MFIRLRFILLAGAVVTVALILLARFSPSENASAGLALDCRSFTGTPTVSPTPSPTPSYTPVTYVSLCNDASQAATDLHIQLTGFASNPTPVTGNPLGCNTPTYTYDSGPPYTSVDIVWDSPCIAPGEIVSLSFTADCTTTGPPNSCYGKNILCFYWTLDGATLPPASPAQVNPQTCEPSTATPSPTPVVTPQTPVGDPTPVGDTPTPVGDPTPVLTSTPTITPTPTPTPTSNGFTPSPVGDPTPIVTNTPTVTPTPVSNVCPARPTPPITSVPTPFNPPPAPFGTSRDILQSANIPFCNNSGQSASDLHIHFAYPYSYWPIVPVVNIPGCPNPTVRPNNGSYDEFDMDITWSSPCVDAGESFTISFIYACGGACPDTDAFCYTWTLNGEPLDSDGACPPDLRRWGDLDCDGFLRMADVLTSLRFLADTPSPPANNDCPSFGETIHAAGETFPWGDINCDGQANAADTLSLVASENGLSPNQRAGCPPLDRRVVVS